MRRRITRYRVKRWAGASGSASETGSRDGGLVQGETGRYGGEQSFLSRFPYVQTNSRAGVNGRVASYNPRFGGR